MPHPALLVVFRVYLPIAAFLAISGAQAQNIETTASCSNFKVFQLNPSDPTNPPINVFGVNDWVLRWDRYLRSSNHSAVKPSFATRVGALSTTRRLEPFMRSSADETIMEQA